MYSDEEMLSIICARDGTNLTQEQREFARDFTVPTLSMSDPGTGKSKSTVLGIIFNQLQKGIPGNRINAMSYTKEATAELAAKYNESCMKCGTRPTATFNTFHSICRRIVLRKLNSLKINGRIDYEKDLPRLKEYLVKIDEFYEEYDMTTMRKVLEAINKLNAQLAYTRDKVENSYAFAKIDIPYEHFTQLRKRWFVMGMLTQNIHQGDLPLYALYILLKYPEVSQEYKEKYWIMIVDEFQDLTSLNLKVLSLIARTLVAIGDIKQQIYGFNGACSRIVEEFYKYYPNARSVALTHSFRCKQELADFATDIVRPNDMTIEPFVGNGTGAVIQKVPSSQLSVPEIIASIKDQKLYSQDSTGVDTMFLYRNNISITPIAEELYRQKVPFRVKNFKTIMKLPIFGVMCQMVDLALNDRDVNYLKYVIKIFPEFKNYTLSNCPVIQAIKVSGVGLLSVPYEFKEQSSLDILNALRRAKSCVEKKLLVSQVFASLADVYDRYVIEGKWWKLDYDKEFYYAMVNPIITNKTYEVMIEQEYDKDKVINDCVALNTGIRCYTMHTGKGLEANHVYILDCDEGVFPNDKMINNYEKEGCYYEACLNIRTERNLLFVGATRAKDSLTIVYNGALTKLVEDPYNSGYEYLDKYYDEVSVDEDDSSVFMELLSLD